MAQNQQEQQQFNFVQAMTNCAEGEQVEAAKQHALRTLIDVSIPAGTEPTPQYKVAETLLDAVTTATAGNIDPERVAEAQEHAAAVERDIAISDSMEQGKFDDAGAFVPLDDENRAFMANLYDTMKKALKTWQAFMMSEEVQQLRQTFTDFNEWLKGTAPQRSIADVIFFADMAENLKPLVPYFMLEVEELQQTPGMEGITFADFMRSIDADGNPIESYFEKALKRAQERKETAEAAAEVLKALPRLQSIAPKKHTIPNNALANSLQHGVIGSGENARTGDLTVGHKGKQEITTLVSVNYTPETGVTIKSTNYTEFDRQVQNAVVSLWLYGDESHIITPAMVARAMTGKNDSSTPSAQFLGAITKSIEKQRRIDAEIDATEEITSYLKSKGKPVPAGTTFHWRDFLLSVRMLDVKNGKQKVTAYFIKDAPVLLQYAELTGQLLTVKASLLDVKEIDKLTGKASTVSIPNTDSRIAIKGYLLRRVEVIKHDRKAAAEALRKYNDRRKHNAELPAKQLEDFTKQKPVILFESVFAETGISTTDRKQTMKYREYAFAVMDYWKAEGYIDGYHQQKKTGKGNPVTGIIIDFDE